MKRKYPRFLIFNISEGNKIFTRIDKVKIKNKNTFYITHDCKYTFSLTHANLKKWIKTYKSENLPHQLAVLEDGFRDLINYKPINIKYEKIVQI